MWCSVTSHVLWSWTFQSGIQTQCNTQADFFNSLDPQPLISEEDENFPPTMNFCKSQYIRQRVGALNSLFPLTVKLFWGEVLPYILQSLWPTSSYKTNGQNRAFHYLSIWTGWNLCYGWFLWSTCCQTTQSNDFLFPCRGLVESTFFMLACDVERIASGTQGD